MKMWTKYNKRISICVVIIALCISFAPCAFAGFGFSDDRFETVDGVEYKFYSIIHNEDDDKIGYQTSLYPSTAETVEEGAMGVRARLYSSEGVLIASTTWDYNTFTDRQMLLQSSTYKTSSGFYYSKGQVKLYNGKTYITYDSYATANFSPKNAPSPKEIIVQRNEYGEIYGSEFILNEIGVQPDLILAKSESGTIGYVRFEDVNADDALTPTDALEAMENRTPRTIPVYKSDGRTIIGTFTIQCSEDE